MKAPEVSAGMGARKVDAVEATGADYVASTEPSCLLQLDGPAPPPTQPRPNDPPRRDPRCARRRAMKPGGLDARIRAAVADPVLRATSCARRTPPAPTAGRWSPSGPTGRRSARARAPCARTSSRTSTATSRRSPRTPRRAARTCTRRATPTRPARSCSALVRSHGGRRILKSKSMTTEEIDLNPALEAAGLPPPGDGPRRVHRAARGGAAIAHHRARPPPLRGADPRPLPAGRRAGGSRRGAPRPRRARRAGSASRRARTCARASSTPTSASPAPTSSWRRRARSCWWRTRATSATRRPPLRCRSPWSASRR